MLTKDDLNLQQFPFGVELSVKPLIDYWQKSMKGKNLYRDSSIEKIQEELDNAPELFEPIYDSAVINKHMDLLRCLFSVVFPEAWWDSHIFAAMHPFTLKSFIHSSTYNELIKPVEDMVPTRMNMPADILLERRKIGIYSFILAKLYGIISDSGFPFVYSYEDPKTLLRKYLKLNLANEFMTVRFTDDPVELSDENRKLIEDNLTDYDLLERLLPPEKFTLSGFMVVNGIDVTDQEIVSSMKQDLIRKDTLYHQLSFLKMQQKLQSLLKDPNILMGLVELPGEGDALFEYGRKITFSFSVSDNINISDCDGIEGSIYEEVLKTGQHKLVNNLEHYKSRTILEENLLKQGIKNIYIAPITFDERTVGILEIGSEKPGRVTPAGILRLEGVLPLFGVAIARGMEDLENKVQSVIKEECTAIHPSVEWRFRKAALKVIYNKEEVENPEMEDIVFKDVYPLYGLSDIRNSSSIRNDMIKEDLVTNLNLADKIITLANSHQRLHSLGELSHRIGKQIESVNFGLASGDELSILGLLKNEIEPMFKHIKDFSDDVSDAIETYQKTIDSEHGFVYKQRKAYEKSVSRLTDIVCNHLENEQNNAQLIYPHYFERYKTDGVDHTMYIGGSMVEGKPFDKIYLRNLRLWQFITTCSMVRKAEAFKSYLDIPLEIASLILVQDVPLSIRFRYDEKKFDVDGAYNVRYEIMKKRIDKAEIKGGEERLTQPGKIAIVYSHQGEVNQYLEYIDYLSSNGYLKKDVEKLDIENLQGVHGLKALRVSVNLDEKTISEALSEKEIECVNKNN